MASLKYVGGANFTSTQSEVSIIALYFNKSQASYILFCVLFSLPIFDLLAQDLVLLAHSNTHDMYFIRGQRAGHL